MKFKDIGDFMLAGYGLCKALGKFQELDDRIKTQKAEKKAKQFGVKSKNKICGYTDLRFHSHEEAERVIDRMQTRIDAYGDVRIGELYDIIGLCTLVDGEEWEYGWRDLTKSSIVKTSNGWLIIFPKPKRIRKEHR